MRLRRAAVVLLLWSAIAPTAVQAGGTAVVAPKRLDAEACRQGTPAPMSGVPPQPLPTTVIGCLELGKGTRALAAVYQWDHSPGRPPQICFLVAPRGEVEVDGRCTSRWTRHEGRLSNALTGAAGFSAVSARWVGGNLYPRSPTTAIVSGLAVGPRRIAIHGGSCDPSPGNFFRWASTVRVGPRLATRLGARAPFTFFAAAIPRSADPCKPIRVSAAGVGSPRWGVAAARHPRWRHCSRRADRDRTLPWLGDLLDPLGDLLAAFRP
jgi:hypothetical protein